MRFVIIFSNFTSLGFVVGGSSKLLNWGDYKEELPEKGFFFNITGSTQYSVFNLGRDGIYFEYGDLNVPNFILNKGINVRISYTRDEHF